MTKIEFLTMFTQKDGTWDTEKYVKYQEYKESVRVGKINKELNDAKIAYKVEDAAGNTFVYAGLENGLPIYRGSGGRKHIFGMTGLTIIQQYAD